jgi:predicted Zn-dependent peptidase
MISNITTLPNGVKILCLNIPHVSSVTVAANVRVGSRNETEKQNGISHFIEHMAFKGTQEKDAHTIMRDIEHVGASINAYTSEEMTVYHVNGKSDDLPNFVKFISDIVLSSTLPSDEIEKERHVILQEHTMYQDDPGSIVGELFNSVAFPNQPSGRPIIGPVGNIEAFSREDMISYIKEYYTGENTIISAVGNFDEAEFIKLVTDTFGKMPKGEKTPISTVEYKGGVAVKEGKFEQTVLLIGFPIENMFSKTWAADRIAASVIGGGMSSPLFTEIRENRGLVYSVGASADITETAGIFSVYAATTPENFEEYIKEVCVLLKQHTQRIDQTDLDRAKNNIAVSLMRLSESPAKLMSKVVNNIFTLGHERSLDEMLEAYNSVTIEDVKNSIATMLTKTPTLSMCGIGADKKYYDLLIESLK